MSQIIVEPYFYFNGNCEQALEYYKKVFDQPEARVMRYSEAMKEGMPFDETLKDKIMHASLTLGNVNLMMSDDITGEVRSGNAIYINYFSPDEEWIKTVWERMVDGGAMVEMSLKEEFFAKLYGSLRDPFGITWQLMAGNEEG